MGASITGMRIFSPRKVVEVAGPEAPAGEGEAVAAQGGLGLGAADDVVPDALVKVAPGGEDDLLIAHELGTHCVPPLGHRLFVPTCPTARGSPGGRPPPSRGTSPRRSSGGRRAVRCRSPCRR